MPIDRAQPKPNADPMALDNRLHGDKMPQGAGAPDPLRATKNPQPKERKDYDSVLVRFDKGFGYRDMLDEAAKLAGQSRNEWAVETLLAAARDRLKQRTEQRTAPLPTIDGSGFTTTGMTMSINGGPPIPVKSTTITQPPSLTDEGEVEKILEGMGVVDVLTSIETGKTVLIFKDNARVEVTDIEIADLLFADLLKLIEVRYEAEVSGQPFNWDRDIPSLGLS